MVLREIRTRLAPRGAHRDVAGGTARAAVLGAGDGLVTNLSLVLGVAGASSPAGAVRLAGVAGLLAGCFSMAAGELVSVRTYRELVDREVAVERRQQADDPEGERHELAAMYRARGLEPGDAATVTRILMSTPDLALETHTQLELGISPGRAPSPGRAAVVSFVSFAIGALLPLLPWFFLAGTPGVVASVAVGGVAALVLGAAIGISTGRGAFRAALRQFLVVGVAASVTYCVGRLLGVRVG